MKIFKSIRILLPPLAVCLALTTAQAGSPPATNQNGSSAAGQSSPDARITGGAWLFAYFRQRYESRIEIDAQGHTVVVPLPNPMREEQLHYALSTDGRHWTALNSNRPVWNQRLRDPFLRRGPDGLWHLLATGGRSLPRRNPADSGPVCLSAVSGDLLTWTNVQSLPLMAGVQDEAGRPARNIWAPKWFYDAADGSVLFLWSSSFEDEGWKDSRLWCSRTRDWQQFTLAKILFHPAYSVIDGTLWQHDKTFFLFHKEEEFGASTGERRAIRLATAENLEGPYHSYAGPLNGGQIAPVITEGPSLMPDPRNDGWLLLYDYCMSDGYGISSSADLFHWTVEPSTEFPPDARHGSVVHLTEAEVNRLRATFSN